DEVSLYNRALAESEITYLFAAGTEGKCRPPANNNFANRIILTGSNLTLQATNVGATREPGEPDHYSKSSSHSIWFTWTAPFSGGAVVRAAKTGFYVDFDPVVAVYTGDNLTNLTKQAANSAATNDTPPLLAVARAVFTAVAGQTYQIVIDGCPSGYWHSS